jgi:hypothetical protein
MEKGAGVIKKELESQVLAIAHLREVQFSYVGV